MELISNFSSPLGEITLTCRDGALTGLWFNGQKHFAPKSHCIPGDAPVFEAARNWLDEYFKGREPGFSVPVSLSGTDFQMGVWKILQTIPYGETVTYGDIAKRLGVRSAQAIGGAVGRNPISIIVPCHRVIGANGSLTGYAGGLERKIMLLNLEKGGENHDSAIG